MVNFILVLGYCFDNSMVMIIYLVQCSVSYFNSLNLSETNFLSMTQFIFLDSPYSAKSILQHVIRLSADMFSAHLTIGSF